MEVPHVVNTYQPLRSATDIPRGDTRDTVSVWIVRIYRLHQEVSGIDDKRLLAKCQRHFRRRRARDSESTLAVRGRTGNGSMNSRRVVSGRDDQGRTSIENGGAALQSNVLAVDGNGIHIGFPEALLIDIVKCNERVGIEFRGIEGP